MTDRLVEPILKQSGFKQRSPQQQRRARFETAFRHGKKAVRKRSGGWCEVPGCRRRATSTHHKAGRVGPVEVVNHPDLLMDLCGPHDHRVTTEPEWAKAEGYSVDRVSLPSSKIVERD